MTEFILVVEANGCASMKEIEHSQMLDRLQHYVAGFIEVVRPVNLQYPLVFVCDDMGKLVNKPVNLIASLLYGFNTHGQTIEGDIVILKEGIVDGEPDLVGLTEEECLSIMSQIRDNYSWFYEIQEEV